LNSLQRRWTAKIAKRQLKRGVFVSVVDVQAAINRLVTERQAEAVHLDG
jgi:hypothetical protein